jgi:hypothetical protein
MNTKKDAEKKPLKFDSSYCPVCEKPRTKGEHSKCSRITQLKHMKERGMVQTSDGGWVTNQNRK